MAVTCSYSTGTQDQLIYTGHPAEWVFYQRIAMAAFLPCSCLITGIEFCRMGDSLNPAEVLTLCGYRLSLDKGARMPSLWELEDFGKVYYDSFGFQRLAVVRYR